MSGLDWMEHAACRGHDPDVFFPEVTGPHNAARAEAICRDCPVIGECRDYAKGEQYGIWAGQPRQLTYRTYRTHKPLAPCGTEAAYWRHRRHGEKPCPECTLAQSRANTKRITTRKATA